jgi:hypothetical protein
MTGSWSAADLLPGLYVLGLTEVIAWIARRRFDPIPLRARALFLALVLLLLGPVLFGGSILLPLENLRTAIPFSTLPPADPPGFGLQGDLVHQVAPWLLEVRRSFARGGWPLWNGLSGAGMPLLADPSAEVLQPLILAALPFPVFPSMAVTAALRVWLACAALFLLLRRQGLGEAATTCGACAYGLGGFLMLWLGWPMANCAALLPLALYAVVLCDERGLRRDRALLAAATAALLLGGHPETMLYGMGLTGLFLLARLPRREPEERRALLARAVPALLVGCGLAAPVLLPAADFLPHSSRAAVVSAHVHSGTLGEVVRDAVQPAARAAWRARAVPRLLAIAAPRAFGDLNLYWGPANAIEDGSGFAGGAASLLALLALWPARRTFRAPQETVVKGALLGSLLLIAQPEGLDRILGRLPLIGATVSHQNHRILILVSFCLAFLAACEVERFRRGQGAKAWRVAATALLLAGLIVLALRLAPPPARFGLAPGFLARPLAVELAGLAVAAALLLAGRRRGGGGRGEAAAASGTTGQSELRPRPWALAALIATVAVELLVTFRPVQAPAPLRLAYPLLPPIRFLVEHGAGTGDDLGGGGDRFVGVGLGVFSANFPLVYGLRDARVNNPSIPRTYQTLVAPLLRNQLAITPVFVRPGHPLYDLLGVRYVMARPQSPLGLPVVFQDPSAWIYERPRPLPRLFLPLTARGRDPGSAADGMDWLARNPDFARRALLLDGGDDGGGEPWKAADPAASSLAVLHESGTRVAARALLGERRLVASNVFDDGHWRLVAGGVPRPILRVNGPFAGAWLPAGEWRIDLLYRPWPWIAGCLLAACALALAGTLFVPPPRGEPSFGPQAPRSVEDGARSVCLPRPAGRGARRASYRAPPAERPGALRNWPGMCR